MAIVTQERIQLIKNILLVLLFLVLTVIGIWYTKYQFDLCYPKVSDSVLYCLKHAM